MPVFYPRVSSSSRSSSSGVMWKCAFCGAMNEDENMVCDGCGDERPLMSQSSSSSNPDRTQDFEDMKRASPPTRPSRSLGEDENEEEESLEEEKNTSDGTTEDQEPLGADDDDQDDSGSESEPDLFKSSITDSDEKSDQTSFSNDTVTSGPTPSPPATLPTFERDPLSSYPPSPVNHPQPDYPPSLQPTGSSPNGRYYLVFVNTPAPSLIKSRVSVDFDDFQVITIGRNPENIVVIPDQEVSRKHAQLSIENGRLVLKDLKSANGTYLYDGKEFQRVNGSVEVKPNSILKFGTGTIVRLENG